MEQGQRSRRQSLPLVGATLEIIDNHIVRPASLTLMSSTRPHYIDNNESFFDGLFVLSVVAPLLFCCIAVLMCALNSIWKTRKKLESLKHRSNGQSEPTEYTMEITTKIDSYIELSSAQYSSKEESAYL
ncbi:hypothetical protein Q1695_001604 [Nippostrongylus brasiliensis]|nr:hypothetical protein Q1695_001604 [Nippostrongylus brasiliensis]